MKRVNATVAAFAMTALITGGSSAWAMQEPQPHPQPRPEIIEEPDAAERSATGELVRVDADAQRITLKAADDSEWTFRYTDDTEVTGAMDDVAGLATRSGTRVTVHYTAEGDTRTATRITVAER